MPNHNIIAFAEQPLSWSTQIKYLGCFFNCRNCEVDTASFVARFYGTYNNILNVMGKSNCRNDMVAVHLIKSYCLPSMLYGCEIWSLNRSDTRTLDIAWNNAFHKIFNTFQTEKASNLCACLPIAYVLPMRKIFFGGRCFIVLTSFYIH